MVRGQLAVLSDGPTDGATVSVRKRVTFRPLPFSLRVTKKKIVII
jgi:hypothetical protein